MPYTLENGRILGPSGAVLAAIVQAVHGEGAPKPGELDALRRQIVNALNAADTPRQVRADAVRIGDRVDLEGVQDDPAAEFELATVASLERESADCVRLDFEGFSSHGFAPDVLLTVTPREAFPDCDAWREEERAQAAEGKA